MIKMLKKRLRNTRQKMTQTSHSTGTSTDNSALSEPTSLSGTLSPALFHASAYRLPLDIFIEISVTEELHHLVIEGQPTPLQLQDAFETIINETSSILQNEKSEGILKISRRIALLQWQLIFIEWVLEYLIALYNLKKATNPDLITDLRKMGYNYKFDPAGEYQYRRELEMVRSRAKTLLQTRKDLITELGRMTGVTGSTQAKKKSREDWETEIAELSSFQHYNIDRTTTMTSQYFAVLSRYNRAVKESQKKQSNGRR